MKCSLIYKNSLLVFLFKLLTIHPELVKQYFYKIINSGALNLARVYLTSTYFSTSQIIKTTFAIHLLPI
jgi:S-methylmethionine-dependent homocysteine/selenocysteine methylase